MATLIAYQNGDFTGATTFKALVGGTGSAQETITASTNTTTAYVSSSAFTVTNTHVIEGVMVHCRRLNTTGTVSVALSDDNGVTATREVTVDASDLPDQNSWVFFKFGTTLTGDGGADYKVMVKGSSAGNAVFFRDATAGNWARLLRRDSTATIATTDVVYISGERTGAGSVTTVTVTMDQTATTSYGAMNIGDAGTLAYGTSASTNYYLKLAGNLNVWGNGTLNIGTSGTRIPSTSTAILEFNCATARQFGLFNRAGSTVNLYGAEKDSTQVFLTADAASGQAVVNVTSTVGWEAGDRIAFAPTAQGSFVSESRLVQSVDSSTQATMTANLSNSYSGTAPFIGEVVNLTRNVVVKGISTILGTFVDQRGLFNAEYIEFTYIGATFPNTSGTMINAVSNPLVHFCSFWHPDAETFNGFTIPCIGVQTSATNIDVQNCVSFNNGCPLIRATVTNSSQVFTIKNNWVIGTNANGNAAGLDFQGTVNPDSVVEGNRISRGTSRDAVSFRNRFAGTVKDNVVHNYATAMLVIGNTRTGEVFDGLTVWRCTTGINSQSDGVTFTNLNLYSNTTNLTNTAPNILVTDSVFNGPATQNLNVARSATFENCDFDQTTASTRLCSVPAEISRLTFRNCDFDPVTFTFLNQSNLLPYPDGSPSWIAFDKLNSTSGNHRAYKQFGYAGSDQSVYRTASPSEVLVPNSASGKLPSGSKKFGVANGNDATVSVWVRKSSTYNGAEPRLILKRNIVGGVTSDQVLATASGANETWLELTASTPTVTDDCVLEVYVDCSATAGVVNIDDWAIS